MSSNASSGTPAGTWPHLNLGALDLPAYVLNDLRIRQRGGVPHVHEVGDGSDHTAHYLSGPSLGQVFGDPNVSGPRYWADDSRGGLLDLIRHLFGGIEAGLEGDIDLGHSSFELVVGGHGRGLAHRFNC